jgi:NAD(P)-dependent dehydrogenase (short-subunit alcohol dehydrogenase family)
MTTAGATRIPPDLAAELPSFDLGGRTALVMGGARGLGRGIALALAAAGADVAISSHADGSAAAAVCEAIRRLGRRVRDYAHDVALEAGVDALRDAVARDFGHVDILVHGAALGRDRTPQELDAEAWDEVLTANLTGVFLVTKQFIDAMAARGWGRVITVSGLAGAVGTFGRANYAAAAAGLVGLTRALAREYARTGVTVNAVAAGVLKTQRTADLPAAALDAVLAITPVGRLGEPLEVAAGVAFLASPAAGFITGAVLDITGGLSM